MARIARKKRRRKPAGVSKLMKDADSVFSRYKRLSGANSEGFVACFTCGHTAHWKKMQNGHYISRFYKKYRFSENNTRVQCSMCNLWKSGDIPTFRAKLLQEIGQEALESMESDYKELFKLTPDYLHEIIDLYTAKLKDLW